ncbi:MAG: glutamate--cysteine ligase [Gammaproteobacteria bacterium]|nr:glutamate--cysteine ligase [Gammaproteobacteria bacterium]
MPFENNLATVPHLLTAHTGPLHEIEEKIITHHEKIEQWFREQFIKTPAPFYGSVDLRNAGFKLAPVDTNLFPAGFNNLNPASKALCIQALQIALEKVCPSAMGILIIAENHTRNLFYLESLRTLLEYIHLAGYKAEIGTLREEIKEPESIELPSKKMLTLHPILRDKETIKTDDFTPCAIILNNDLSGGRPTVLENLTQTIIPPLHLGWTNRFKSDHFAIYNSASKSLAKLIGIDPWLINPLFRNCGAIDFMKREGENCLAENTEKLLTAIQLKYDEYGIKDKPYVVIKADQGTYGMGIMTVSSVEEVRQLNRKQRTKMSASKEGGNNSDIILQEGVSTLETFGDNQATAEPVVYMIDHFVVGGFYRMHGNKSSTENLNSPGASFKPLAFADCCNSPDQNRDPDDSINRFYAYGVVGRLALLAAAREIASE